MIPTYIIDPDEKLDYGFDLSEWLEDGDTISNASWDAGDLTEHAESTTETQTAVMVSGGEKGHVYKPKVTVTTAEGRVLVRRLALACAER